MLNNIDNQDCEPDCGQKELDASWQLFCELLSLKTSDSRRGREWAVAATQAEKLYAWINHVITAK